MNYTPGRNITVNTTFSTYNSPDVLFETVESGTHVYGTTGSVTALFGLIQQSNPAWGNLKHMAGEPCSLRIAIDNKASGAISIALRDSTSASVAGNTSTTVEISGVWPNSTLIQQLRFSTAAKGQEVDFTFGKPELYFGELPESRSDAPENTTIAGTPVASDNIKA